MASQAHKAKATNTHTINGAAKTTARCKGTNYYSKANRAASKATLRKEA